MFMVSWQGHVELLFCVFSGPVLTKLFFVPSYFQQSTVQVNQNQKRTVFYGDLENF